ncbi:MAG: hypothetical protein ABI851_12095 [Saprospiraceae bacterium]
METKRITNQTKILEALNLKPMSVTELHEATGVKLSCVMASISTFLIPSGKIVVDKLIPNPVKGKRRINIYRLTRPEEKPDNRPSTRIIFHIPVELKQAFQQKYPETSISRKLRNMVKELINNPI